MLNITIINEFSIKDQILIAVRLYAHGSICCKKIEICLVVYRRYLGDLGDPFKELNRIIFELYQ